MEIFFLSVITSNLINFLLDKIISCKVDFLDKIISCKVDFYKWEKMQNKGNKSIYSVSFHFLCSSHDDSSQDDSLFAFLKSWNLWIPCEMFL